jgi:hypothetical protein
VCGLAVAGDVPFARVFGDSARDGESAPESEHLGFLAHELRNLTNTAMVAFEVLKTGNVGVGGSTGGVVHRSLLAIRALVDRPRAEGAEPVAATKAIPSDRAR